jgi:cell wall-associated protease
LKAFSPEDEDVLKAKETLMAAINRFGSLARFGRIYNYYSSQLKYYYNKEFNPRAEIVGDDPSDFEDTIYGNNDVIGPDASHGTHVAGIIAAVRDNDLGIKGVATNFKSWFSRVVPNGDERDKDVALSVRYAADKGARIINMSFGKGYSPYKREVDDAFQYAADKNVLLVHAAGNDNQNSDSIRSFPHKWKKDRNGLHLNSIPGWLEIGASTAYKGLNLPADFSNYGRLTVDFFAPGYDINSTVPGNEYAVYSGTSMATPVVSGVAALIFAQHPEITAVQMRDILRDQVRMYDGLRVRRPGSGQFDVPVPFRDLSTTGGIVDLYSSLKLIYELANH